VDLFTAITRYFWAICLAVSATNYIVGSRAAASFCTDDPRSSDEAKSLRRWFGVASTIPWVVMGVGEIIGRVPNISYYFRPRDCNPYVWTWYGSIFLLAVIFAYWVYFRGGAEKTVDLELIQFFSRNRTFALTSGRVKLFAALGPVWIAACIAVAASINEPVLP
jgi:hypothetical protein